MGEVKARKSKKPASNVPSIMSKSTKSTKSTKTTPKKNKSGLIFPVSRITTRLKTAKPGGKKMRVGGGASTFVTGLLEFFAKEIVEAACRELIGTNRKRIQIEHVIAAVRRDDEIHKALHGTRILCGDKIPMSEISAEILTREQKEAREAAREAAKAAREAAREEAGEKDDEDEEDEETDE